MERQVARPVVPIKETHRREIVEMAQNSTFEPQHDPATIVQGAVDTMKASSSRLVEQGTTTMSDTLNATRDYVGRVRDAGQEYAERAYETGRRKTEAAAFYTELGYEEARDWTRSHPMQALGLAAGFGLLIGLVVARR